VAGVKGRSGHIGRIGIDRQSPIFIHRGTYRAEKADGKGKDMYFENQDTMLDVLEEKRSYTPMVWNEEKKMYVIDWDSADLLGL
jgi:hypothetical protein